LAPNFNCRRGGTKSFHKREGYVGHRTLFKKGGKKEEERSARRSLKGNEVSGERKGGRRVIYGRLRSPTKPRSADSSQITKDCLKSLEGRKTKRQSEWEEGVEFHRAIPKKKRNRTSSGKRKVFNYCGV